jgi:hypothetical protein
LVWKCEEEIPAKKFLELSKEQFHEATYAVDLVGAPDADEAFDDGSHILQFDIGDQVRLVAFKGYYWTK